MKHLKFLVTRKGVFQVLKVYEKNKFIILIKKVK